MDSGAPRSEIVIELQRRAAGLLRKIAFERAERSFELTINSEMSELPDDQVHVSQEEPVYARLSALGIAFVRYEHAAAATVQEAEEHWAGIDAMHFKNLFVRNQKGTRHYLLIVRHSKRADLRAIADQIGDGKLSFGSPERLMTHLGVTPGSVSPFGLIHDRGSGGPRRDRSRSEIRGPRVVSPEHQHGDDHRGPRGLREISRGSAANPVQYVTVQRVPVAAPCFGASFASRACDLICHTPRVDCSHMAKHMSEILHMPESEWMPFPGGELEGKRPKRLCPACRQRSGQEIGNAQLAARGTESAGTRQPLCFQCYRLELDRERALEAAGAARHRFGRAVSGRAAVRAGEPGAAVDAQGGARRGARRVSSAGVGRFADRRRQAQIAARHALQAIAAGLKRHQASQPIRGPCVGRCRARGRAPAPGIVAALRRLALRVSR